MWHKIQVQISQQQRQSPRSHTRVYIQDYGNKRGHIYSSAGTQYLHWNFAFENIQQKQKKDFDIMASKKTKEPGNKTLTWDDTNYIKDKEPRQVIKELMALGSRVMGHLKNNSVQF